MDNIDEIYDIYAIQKFIAFSLIGYLQTIIQYGYIDLDINFTFRPVVAAKKMKLMGLDPDIIDAMLEIDELGALYELGDKQNSDKAIKDTMNRLFRFVERTRVNNYSSHAVVGRILDSNLK